ncbi:MAG: hypothetical protein JSV52_15110 [Candidatus Zixiibacteriota bacterium]|nr:MAG: hypothetical protein JSV52_15110 [candidate division Zixibacteria bacterium]
MVIFEHNNFRWKRAIRLVGVVFVLLLCASSLQANSADVAATVTVAPRVEALTASAIPLGSYGLYPGGKSAAILALSVRNTYTEAKALSTITIHDASRGAGTPAQLLSNVDSLFLFKDLDGDSLLSISDSLMVSDAWDAADMLLPLGALNIGKDSAAILLLAVKVALFPRDGDSVDVYLRPASDIGTSDATPVTGADSLNSLGYGVIDGLVAAQLNTPATGLTSIGTGDTVYNVFTVDIPRNGYASDTLRSFTIHNAGTANQSDLEFVVLFSDNGNGVWGGFSEENLIAPLEYTGAHWAVSNLDVPLSTPTTRFYLGAKTLPYPVNGADVILSIPEYGILVASRNDGPLDAETQPVDTIEIQSEEGLLVTSIPLSPGSLIPGEISSPVFAFELRNGSRDVVQLDSIDLELELIDPTGEGSVAELESQLDSLLLYEDKDGDPTSIGPSDLLVGVAPTSIGPCRFATGGIQIDAGGSEVGLSVVVASNIIFARNANTVDISLDSEADIFISPSTTIFGSFPVSEASIFTIDAFPAEKVAVNHIAAENLYGGQTNIPILDFVAPGNGYAEDTLESLIVENIGSVDDGVALEALNLWRDLSGDGFTPGDVQVAALTHGAISWSATGFSQTVANSGQRFILTVDISDGQFDGGTLGLSIPTAGMIYASGMVGPDDYQIADDNTHLIIPPQRITVVSVPTVSTTVYPGSTNNTILTFALYNGYINESKTLRSIRFSNISRSISDVGYADHEIGRIRLYYDADANRVLDGDPLIGSGYFDDGVVTIAGLSLGLPSESLAYFFVQSDVASDAIDSDSLALSVNGIADFIFQESVSINGDLPLTGGGWHIIDGSVKCQYEVLALASQSVSPGEVLVPVMAFRPASNGNQDDTLISLTVSNAGTADTTDFTNLRLWIDSNGDDTWQVTDVLVGSLNFTGGWWSAGGFALAIPPTPPTVFITVDIQPGGTDGRSINLTVPTGGCLYTSGNDGPIDSTIQSGAQFTLTGSNLRVAHHPSRSTYSVGETIEVEFSATNLSGSTMDNVVGICSLIGDPATVRLDSAQLGPVSLPSSDSAEFASYYTAMQPGTISWSLQAVETVIDDSSSVLITDPCQIQAVPSGVEVDFASSMPATVTLGQKNIISMSLGFSHADTEATAAAAVLDSLRVQVFDSNGSPVPADEVFSRLRVITDEMFVIEPPAIPSLPEVTFIFGQPVVVEPGTARNLSVIVDIDSLATAAEFRLAVSDVSSVIFRDCNSGVEVPVSAAAGFPLTTTVSRIERPPDQLLVAALDQADENINLGQEGARLFRLTLRHPGVAGTAPIQFTELSMAAENDSYESLNFADIFDVVEVVHRGNVSAMVTGANLDSGLITLALSSPPILGPGDSDTLDLRADLRSDAPLNKFRMIADSSRIIARNFSTGEDVPVNLDPTVMPPGAVFPLHSGWLQTRDPAQVPFACLSSTPGLSVLAGADTVSLMSLVLTYPATDDYSSLIIRDMSLIVLDSTDLALDPRRLFDRLGYIVNDSPAQFQSSVDPISGQTVFEFGTEGIVLSPADTLTVQLVADLDAGVPYDHFLLRLSSLENIRLTDATDSLRHPEAVLDATCEVTVPFVAGPVSILWPAGRPTLNPQPPQLALASAGQHNVRVFDAEVEYVSQVPRGDLLLDSFAGSIYRRTKDGFAPVSGSSVFESVRLRVNDEIWAYDSLLATSTTLLWSNNDYLLEQNSTAHLQLEVDIKTDARPGNYVFGFGDSTFISFIDENVDTSLYSILVTGSYPLTSTELSISAPDLKGSFTNYPNPFVASGDDGVTTFGYVLSEGARISIKLYTSTGQLTATVVDDVYKSADTEHKDTWDGRNNRGLTVAPGTYVCVATADYDSGRHESVKRKVTVVR